MQLLEVSGAVRLIYRSLGVKGLTKSAFVIYFPNGRYIDCSSLTYATNKSKR